MASITVYKLSFQRLFNWSSDLPASCLAGNQQHCSKHLCPVIQTPRRAVALSNKNPFYCRIFNTSVRIQKRALTLLQCKFCQPQRKHL